MKVYLKNPQATEKFGNILGNLLRDGDVLCLTGDLGAGKTLLCKGLAMARGVDAAMVTSPTFTIMNIYDGDINIRHFDFYRLQNAEELDDIGFDEYCGGKGITLIEWGELFKERLPSDYLQISLYRDGDGRNVELVAKGQHYEDLVGMIKDVYTGN